MSRREEQVKKIYFYSSYGHREFRIFLGYPNHQSSSELVAKTETKEQAERIVACLNFCEGENILILKTFTLTEVKDGIDRLIKESGLESSVKNLLKEL